MKIIDLKQVVKIAAVAAVAVAGCFALIPASKPDFTPSAVSTESDAQASTYRANCARCHGNDGHANTREGRRVEADDLTEDSVKGMSDAKMTRTIKNGKGKMPAFKKLSAAQISGLIRYVRSL